MPLAAMTDQSFLLSFALSAVCAALASQVWRILVLNRPDPDPTQAATTPVLDPVEAALVAGGEQLAFTVAKASLRSAGLIDAEDRAIRAPSDGEDVAMLPRALLRLSTTTSPLTWQRCAADVGLQDALGALAADLRRRGLLLTRDRRRLLQLAASPLALVEIAGLWRVVHATSTGRVDGALVVATSFVALICAALLATVPHGTRLGLDLTRARELDGPAAVGGSSVDRCRGHGDNQPVPR